MKIRTVVAAVAVGIFSFGIATACEFGSKKAESYESIGLTQELQTKVETLREGVKAMRDESEKKIEELRVKIDEELLKKAPDAKALKSLQKQQGDLRAKIAGKRVDALLQVKKIISEQQFAKLIGMNWGCRCVEPDSTKK